MELSKEQIDSLFQFTEKKFVKWYDLQVEIVDHLANKIEEDMGRDSTLTFENALNNVYASFGITGFSRIVEQKSEQVRRNNIRLWKEAFFSLFKFPTIVKSILIFFALKTVIDFTPMFYLFFASLVLACIIIIVELKNIFKRKILTKRLMLTQYIGAPFFSSFVLIHIWFNLWEIESFNLIFTKHPILLLIITYFTLLSYVATKIVTKQLEQKAITLYPEVYKIA